MGGLKTVEVLIIIIIIIMITIIIIIIITKDENNGNQNTMKNIEQQDEPEYIALLNAARRWYEITNLKKREMMERKTTEYISQANPRPQ